MSPANSGSLLTSNCFGRPERLMRWLLQLNGASGKIFWILYSYALSLGTCYSLNSAAVWTLVAMIADQQPQVGLLYHFEEF